MEQLLYFIVFIIYVVYSIYQSVQKEGGNKKVVEDWEGQPLSDERSIEEILASYLEPEKAALTQETLQEEAVAAEKAKEEKAKTERSLVQDLREDPNNRRERKRRKLYEKEDETSEEEEERELSPTEEFNRRIERERKEELEKGKELSAAEEYELLAAERLKERDSFRSSVNLKREEVKIKDRKQLDEINEIYGKKKLFKKGSFKFSARDAIIYQIIMNRKY